MIFKSKIPSCDDLTRFHHTKFTSIAYVFADDGYDVWLPNWRGSTYSRNHTSKSPNESSFWNFTDHEIGTRDYPTVIKYVRSATGKNIFVAAHSHGGSSLLALLSEMPEYNQYITAASLMAPVTYLNHSADLYKELAKVASTLKVCFVFIMQAFDFDQHLNHCKYHFSILNIRKYFHVTQKIAALSSFVNSPL